jgi:N-acyl-D-amino-acid deacylase
MLDLLIAGGMVIDGSGTPRRRADVGIVGDRISAVAPLAGARAGRVIDASGLVVAPGFIDMHSHADFTLPALPTADSKVAQGFTLEVVGNCGASPAPLAPEQRGDVIEAAALVVPPLAWDWTSFGSFLESLRRRGTGVNVAALVGHGTLRIRVMGMDARPATPAELRALAREARQAMDEGAVGLSTGLIYPPGVVAGTDELVTLARAVGEAGGLYASHIRGEGDTLEAAVAEAIEIGRRAALPVQISHLKAAGRPNWPKMAAVIARIEAARAEGLDVTADMYPYRAGSASLRSLLPDWAQAGGRAALLGRLGDGLARRRVAEALEGPGIARDAGWDGVYLASYPVRPEYEGRSLADLALERKRAPSEAVLDLLLEGEGEADMISFMMSEENVTLGLGQPFVMIGSDGEGRTPRGPCAGGKPHPRNYGTCPRLLGHYVRERGVLSLETAIRKLTGLPAEKLRLRDRGVLEPGAFADVVIFDAGTVADTATFADPHRYPVGIPWVLVNGQPVIAEGRHTAARPGRILTAA